MGGGGWLRMQRVDIGDDSHDFGGPTPYPPHPLLPSGAQLGSVRHNTWCALHDTAGVARGGPGLSIPRPIGG